MKTDLYDDTFSIKSKLNGLYESYDIDGKAIILAPTEKSCLDATRYHLEYWKDRERASDSLPLTDEKYVDL